ncbi:hypothetical protein A2U01_0105029, partial [Trifolium medium]|nr:hypothetical protein [Trifolium medium]
HAEKTHVGLWGQSVILKAVWALHFPADVMCFGAYLEVLGGFGGASMVW